MLVVTLGTPASGSTWIFNVVRAIVSTRGLSAVSLSSDDAVDLLDNLPLGMDLVLLKAHSLDLRLLRLIALAEARVIVSLRDPRDSVVSQFERFALPMPVAASDISRSFASIRMLPDGLDRLILQYEDRFFERIDTILTIARFLDIALPIGDAMRIQAELRPDAVRAVIAMRLAALDADSPPVHDVATQWHPDHIGDGRIGKWQEKLGPRIAEAVSRCLVPISRDGDWRIGPILWSREMFCVDEEIAGTDDGALRSDGRERVMIFGPYLHLPVGRWRARLLAVAAPDRPARVTIDVHLRLSGRGTVTEREIDLRSGATEIEFDHHDHFEPIEVRIRSIEHEIAEFTFIGVTMTWIGDAATLVLSSMPIRARDRENRVT